MNVSFGKKSKIFSLGVLKIHPMGDFPHCVLSYVVAMPFVSFARIPQTHNNFIHKNLSGRHRLQLCGNSLMLPIIENYSFIKNHAMVGSDRVSFPS